MTDREVMRSGWVVDTLDEINTIGTASSDPPPPDDCGASASPSWAPPKAPTRPTRPASQAPTFGSADAPPPPYVESEPAPPAFDADYHRPGFLLLGVRPRPFDYHLGDLDSAYTAATPRRRTSGAPWDGTHRAWMWFGGLGVFACFVAAAGLTVASLKLLDDKDVGAAGIIAMISTIVEGLCMSIVLPCLYCCLGGAAACAWFALVILEAASIGVYVIYVVDRTNKADICATTIFGDCTRGVSLAAGMGVCRILMVVFAALIIYVYGLKTQWWRPPRRQILRQSDPDMNGAGSPGA
ncbi:uncharacterized protein B0H64DRAFT_386127 [Chaetomium fimeti]|uniref:Uncharacterized protein n=1 Tax=Chaetomium fimeti TaxID=1854472 RepID=A0AAE0LV87_9PEZI|nr:hypothetical protein B0H64DRAFT_386127 [Chaetomium fimeti]